MHIGSLAQRNESVRLNTRIIEVVTVPVVIEKIRHPRYDSRNYKIVK